MKPPTGRRQPVGYLQASKWPERDSNPGITGLRVRCADHSATLPSLKSLMDASSTAVSSNGEIYGVQSIKKISTDLSPKLIGMVWWNYRLGNWGFRKVLHLWRWTIFILQMGSVDLYFTITGVKDVVQTHDNE